MPKHIDEHLLTHRLPSENNGEKCAAKQNEWGQRQSTSKMNYPNMEIFEKFNGENLEQLFCVRVQHLQTTNNNFAFPFRFVSFHFWCLIEFSLAIYTIFSVCFYFIWFKTRFTILLRFCTSCNAIPLFGVFLLRNSTPVHFSWQASLFHLSVSATLSLVPSVFFIRKYIKYNKSMKRNEIRYIQQRETMRDWVQNDISIAHTKNRKAPVFF